MARKVTNSQSFKFNPLRLSVLTAKRKRVRLDSGIELWDSSDVVVKLFQRWLTIAATVGFTLLTQMALGQDLVRTIGPSNSWTSVASSADGRVLVAAAGHQFSIGNFSGGVFISTNSSRDWFQANLPTNFLYTGIACSADGSRMAATYLNGGLYYSTDFGATWTSNSIFFPPKFSGLAHPIASSADGTKLAVSCAMIYTSADGGASWTSNNISGPRYASVASSADGNRLAVTSLSDTAIYLSTNAGLTWTTNIVPNASFQDIASSADGRFLIAAGSSQVFGSIYTSSDAGMTWVSNNAPKTVWQTVALSANGAFAAAGISTLSLATNNVWSTNAVPGLDPGVVALASSADGAQWIVATRGGVQPGHIFVLNAIRPPELKLISTDVSGLALSWLVPSTNFILQQSSDLISWSGTTNTPVFNFSNLENEILLTPSDTNGFYRLSTP